MAKPTAHSGGASIAAAPDHGALLTYVKEDPAPAPAPVREGAMTRYPVAICEAHAFRALATGEIVVPPPDGGKLNCATNATLRISAEIGRWSVTQMGTRVKT